MVGSAQFPPPFTERNKCILVKNKRNFKLTGGLGGVYLYTICDAPTPQTTRLGVETSPASVGSVATFSEQGRSLHLERFCYEN